MSLLTAKLKEKKGSGELVACVAAMLTILALVVICISGFKLINKYTTLNTFGDQYIRTVAQEGCTNDDRITKRYTELSGFTGLSPAVTFDADYMSGSETRVQYGDTMKMKLTLNTELSACGINIPVTLTITKAAQSEQYWK